MKLLITKGDPRLEGKVLDLKQISEYLYFCSNHNIEIVDCEDEIYSIENFKPKKGAEFYRMHLFTQDFGDTLAFIDDVKIV